MTTETQQTGRRRRSHVRRHADRHRQPHRQAVRGPDRGRHDPRHRAAQDQDRRRRLRADDLRPGLHGHRVVPLGDHLHRRRQGHPGVPRLPDRAARREVDLSRGRLSADPRRAADRRLSSTSGRTRSRSTRSCTRTSRSSCRASATTRTRWGCCWRRSARCRRSTRRPTAINDHEIRYLQVIRLLAKMPTLAAFSYRHNRGMPYVYPDNDLTYAGQLPVDDLQDDRAQVRARPAARARARRAVHPARRPRAELLDQRGAQRRLLAGRPVLGGRRRRGRAVRPAARWRQRGGAADAAADRDARRTSPTSSRA